MNCMSSLMFESPDVLYRGCIYRFHLLPWHSPSESSTQFKRFLLDKSSFALKVRLQNLPIEKHWIQPRQCTIFNQCYPVLELVPWGNVDPRKAMSQLLYTTATTLSLILISDDIISQMKSSTVCKLMILSAAVNFCFVNSRWIYDLHLK